jgi:hypothetical protein
MADGSKEGNCSEHVSSLYDKDKGINKSLGIFYDESYPSHGPKGHNSCLWNNFYLHVIGELISNQNNSLCRDDYSGSKPFHEFSRPCRKFGVKCSIRTKLSIKL